MNIDANQIAVYVQLATGLEQIAVTEISKVRAFAADNGADDATLKKLDDDYDARVAQAERESGGGVL
jgi:hypothetical protein